MATQKGSVYKDTKPIRSMDRSMCTYMDAQKRWRCKKDDRLLTENDDVDVAQGFQGLCTQCDIKFFESAEWIDLKAHTYLEDYSQRTGVGQADVHELQWMTFRVLALDKRMQTSKDVDPNYILHTKLLWLVEELGEFIKKFKHGKPLEELHEEWIDVQFFWLHIAGLLNMNVGPEFEQKFAFNSKRDEGREQLAIGAGGDPVGSYLTPEDIDKGIKTALEQGSMQMDLEDKESAEKFLDKVELMTELKVECPDCGTKVTIDAKDAMNFMCPNRTCASHKKTEVEVTEEDRPPLPSQRKKDPMGVDSTYDVDLGGGQRMETSVNPNYICGFCDEDFGMDKDKYDVHMVDAKHVRAPKAQDYAAAKKRIEDSKTNQWG